MLSIEEVPFEMTAILGTVEIPMTAYLGLQVGDIIVLDQKIDDGLLVRVGGQQRYIASAGLFETHKAIKIDERVYP